MKKSAKSEGVRNRSAKQNNGFHMPAARRRSKFYITNNRDEPTLLRHTDHRDDRAIVEHVQYVPTTRAVSVRTHMLLCGGPSAMV